MLTDPREAKLPKWAQELIEAERTRAALSWPTEPEPRPAVVYESGTGFIADGYSRPEAGAVLWQARDWRPKPVTMTLRGAVSEGQTYASRPSGAYYATEAEAALALRWHVARDCAARLRKVGN